MTNLAFGKASQYTAESINQGTTLNTFLSSFSNLCRESSLLDFQEHQPDYSSRLKDLASKRAASWRSSAASAVQGLLPAEEISQAPPLPGESLHPVTTPHGDIKLRLFHSSLIQLWMHNSVTVKSFLVAALQPNFALCSIWLLSLTPQVFILKSTP